MKSSSRSAVAFGERKNVRLGSIAFPPAGERAGMLLGFHDEVDGTGYVLPKGTQRSGAVIGILPDERSERDLRIEFGLGTEATNE